MAVSKEFNAEGDSIVLRMVQAVAVPVLGNMCHVFMHGLNRVQVGPVCLTGNCLSILKSRA